MMMMMMMMMTMMNTFNFKQHCDKLPHWLHIQQQLFYGPLYRKFQVSWYQKNHSPTKTYLDHQLSFYQLTSSTMIHSILPVQFTCLTVFLHNICPISVWSPSWSGTLHFIHHTFLHPITVFFSQHMPIPSVHHNLFCCSTKIMSSNPTHSFNSLLGTLSFTLTSQIHLTIFISACCKCYLIFFSNRPGVTYMQHTTSHTTAVQIPSHYQW